MAAGFTVARDKIDALRVFLTERIGAQMEAEPLTPTLTLDGLIAGYALKLILCIGLKSLGRLVREIRNHALLWRIARLSVPI